jgi:hypothetical protein
MYHASMSRRGAKYSDRFSAGRSKIVPFNPGEDPSDRHFRRKEANLARQNTVREFCQQNGIDLKVNNDGHHWIFSKGDQLLEWWPSSAKMVKNKKWKQGMHVHDYEQLMIQARQFFDLPEQDGTSTSESHPSELHQSAHRQSHPQ